MHAAGRVSGDPGRVPCVSPGMNVKCGDFLESRDALTDITPGIAKLRKLGHGFNSDSPLSQPAVASMAG